MSLPWVKLHTTLLGNQTYKRFSPEAKLTFVSCLMLAGLQDQGDFSGRLDVPNMPPISVSDIARDTGLSVRRQRTAMDELLQAHWISQDMLGTFVVERFEEKAGSVSTARTRAFRERSRNAPEEEVEAEVDYASLRSAALAVGTWPQDAPSLQSLARTFLARFGNCRDPKKQSRFVGSYAAVLATFRSRGITIEAAWAACEECWLAGGEVPLFGGKFRDALSYAQGRGAVPRRARSNDRGEEMDRLMAAKTKRIGFEQ